MVVVRGDVSFKFVFWSEFKKRIFGGDWEW